MAVNQLKEQICETLAWHKIAYVQLGGENSANNKTPPPNADLALLFADAKTVFLSIQQPDKNGGPSYACTKQTRSQQEWARTVQNMGFYYYVVNNVKDAQEIALSHKTDGVL